MANDFIDSYTTRHEGVMYGYAGTWKRRENKVSWRAKVRLNAALVDEPAGEFDVPDDTDVTALVKALIEISIEEGVGRS